MPLAALRRWGPFGLAVLVNLVAVYAPSDEGAGAIFPHADKVGHLLLFGAVAWTGRRAGVPLRWLAGVLLAHAMVSELVQGWLLPHRDGDPGDLLADAVGTLLGLAAAGPLARGGVDDDARHDTGGRLTPGTTSRVRHRPD